MCVCVGLTLCQYGQVGWGWVAGLSGWCARVARLLVLQQPVTDAREPFLPFYISMRLLDDAM